MKRPRLVKRWSVFSHTFKKTFYLYGDNPEVDYLGLPDGAYDKPKPAGMFDNVTCTILDDPDPGRVLVDHGPPSRAR